LRPSRSGVRPAACPKVLTTPGPSLIAFRTFSEFHRLRAASTKGRSSHAVSSPSASLNPGKPLPVLPKPGPLPSRRFSRPQGFWPAGTSQPFSGWFRPWGFTLQGRFPRSDRVPSQAPNPLIVHTPAISLSAWSLRAHSRSLRLGDPASWVRHPQGWPISGPIPLRVRIPTPTG